jgi:hypothetical protein
LFCFKWQRKFLLIAMPRKKIWILKFAHQELDSQTGWQKDSVFLPYRCHPI